MQLGDVIIGALIALVGVGLQSLIGSRTARLAIEENKRLERRKHLLDLLDKLIVARSEMPDPLPTMLIEGQDSSLAETYKANMDQRRSIWRASGICLVVDDPEMTSFGRDLARIASENRTNIAQGLPIVEQAITRLSDIIDGTPKAKLTKSGSSNR